ncbi:ribosome small subunit-dependent GTPase A [Brevundimonas vesicularis]|uniref:ribosome small subunit-dependent GTPase A n=1 Tax=Brevundimonas vesicularis TaxID=41276 RepID=UPI0022EC8D35|nr:ribosome small subunit-dependent GTPase A [Brevundimonas vesicularis]WBT06949.1 ribosome small subunit-dependent GTPase A [Brevundimonas vesicularis]
MIEQYGWSEVWATAFAPHAHAGHTPGRVILQHRNGYLVVTDAGELQAKASGRLRHEAQETGPPAVGDWVALSPNPQDGAATIHAVLPRRTAFVRRAADSVRRTQILAANIDVAFVVTSMNADLNPRRIQRFLAAAMDSGARPVLVLTKSDLSADPQAELAQVAALEAQTLVLTVSAREGVGLEALRLQVKPGETCVLIGSSGVGKSTLVNAFLNEDRMATQAIRASDDQGRHTTSHRQVIPLPGGGLIIDTPGIREVGLIDAEEGVEAVFDDIEHLMQECRFTNCGHVSEPGCAVQAALADGTLEGPRWAHFQKLKSELAAAGDKAERIAKAAERRRLGGLQKVYRATKRNDRGGADR